MTVPAENGSGSEVFKVASPRGASCNGCAYSKQGGILCERGGPLEAGCYVPGNSGKPAQHFIFQRVGP